jgi:tetratricopeptide (TPR) repeat protein
MSQLQDLDRVILDAENPWPGLHEFDERGKEFFNGRDRELADLLRIVNDATLTVLFGASGLGKTSLLLAGLVPSLREQSKLAVYIRLDPRDQRAPLIEQVAAAFRAELAAHEVDHPPFPAAGSLWEYLHRADLELWSKTNQLLTPVFIFDQFEELFTLGSKNVEAVRGLKDDLADLVENRVPVALALRFEDSAADTPQLELQTRRFKVVLSFREDFLAEVEGWRTAIPSLVRKRFRLLAMNGEQALIAVTKTGGRLVDETIGRAIVSFVAAVDAELHSRAAPLAAASGPGPANESDDWAQLTIEPALLSLVCTGLNERRKIAHKVTIDEGLLSGTGRAIVTEFYEGCVRDLPDRARRFIEDELITESGFRNPYSREDAVAQGYLSDGQLEALVKRRLLRVERHLGADRVELVHDLLTSVVRTFRDQERAAEKARRRRRRVWGIAAGGLLVLIVGLVVLSFLREAAFNDRIRAIEQADEDRTHALAVASQRNYDQAIALFSGPISVYKSTGDATRLVRALVDRGRLYALTRKYDLARQDFEHALRTARDVQRPSDEALVLESMASLDDQSGDTDAAVQLYAKALEKFRVVGDSPSIARILEWTATREETNHQFDNASNTYRDALETYLVSGDTIATVRVKKAIDRIAPWGFLVDLKRGKTFTMRGDLITVGRDEPEANVRNELSFTNRYVSRRHLVISREGFRAEDFRTANGTTVNGQLLPYGHSVSLSDGDIICLANMEVLQFATHQRPLPSMPTGTWAVFIDGQTKGYFYLTEPLYSVDLDASSVLQIETGDAHSALLKIRNDRQKPEMFAAVTEWAVLVFFKKGDYVYEQGYLPTDRWITLNNRPSRLVRASTDREHILQEGPAFQIVTTASE